MERILIFGNTPLGARLAFYLTEYGKVKDMPVLVLHHKERINTIDDVQWAIWQTYVGAQLSGRPDLIVNAYELGGLLACETDPAAAWHANSQVAAMIALGARAAEVPLIYISTDHVFRGSQGQYAENIQPNPVNVYGVTKWYGEIVAATLYPHDNITGTTVLRHSDLYGYDVESVLSNIEDRYLVPNTTARPKVVLTDDSSIVPTFIAEAAFLIARNILLTPTALDKPVIHISTKEPPITWANFLSQAQIEWEQIVTNDVVRIGPKRGLSATSGWFLPTRTPQVHWTNFRTEYQAHQPMRFWSDK